MLSSQKPLTVLFESPAGTQITMPVSREVGSASSIMQAFLTLMRWMNDAGVRPVASLSRSCPSFVEHRVLIQSPASAEIGGFYAAKVGRRGSLQGFPQFSQKLFPSVKLFKAQGCENGRPSLAGFPPVPPSSWQCKIHLRSSGDCFTSKLLKIMLNEELLEQLQEEKELHDYDYHSSGTECATFDCCCN